MSLLISYTYHQDEESTDVECFEWSAKKKLALLPTKCHLLFAHTRERHKSFIFTMAQHKKERKFLLFFLHGDKKDFYSTQCEHLVLFAKENSFHLNPLKDYFWGLALVVKGLIWRNPPLAYQA